MIRIQSSDIQTIVDALHAGKVIVYPTETSYAIGCDATNESAVERVIAIKQRRPDKGLPVLVSSVMEARKHIVFNKIAEDIVHKHWPGALNLISVIVPSSKIVDACRKDGMQALRQSGSPFVQALQEMWNGPIVATSANISGAESCYTADAAWAQFEGTELQPDFVVDGGELPVNPASTMVRVVGDRVDVVRFGKLSV
jgi:L-threonylcarbamoyladenylate synthase